MTRQLRKLHTLLCVALVPLTCGRRVNCALEKTNQSLSDEICRLKVLFFDNIEFNITLLRAIVSTSNDESPRSYMRTVQEESDADKRKIVQLQKQVPKPALTAHPAQIQRTSAVTVSEQLRANDENRAANQTAPADKGGMFDGVAKIGRIAMRAFVNGSE